MERVAFPIYGCRVSPVLDSCTCVLIVDFDDGQEVERREVPLKNLYLSERVEILRKIGVSTIVCGGISETLYRMFNAKNVHLIDGIAGDIDRIIEAYACGSLDQVCFFMPGYRGKGKEES